MEEREFSTFGKTIHPGREIKIICQFNLAGIPAEAPFHRFRIVYLKEGHGVFENGNKTQIVTSPGVICLNRHDRIRFHGSDDARMDMLIFDPVCFERYTAFADYESWKEQLGLDSYFFRAFFERNERFIGAIPASRVLGNRIARLIELTGATLHDQPDDFWPCRSRSFFIELLLTVNTAYAEGDAGQNLFNGKMSDDVTRIIEWANEHYLEKIVLDDITKAFNTNKTTLNQRFKGEMGVTVIEYIINLRMQVSCSLLRKTYLPVSEIRERSGYHDDAHFLRAFKKYAGCTPSEYRRRFEPQSVEASSRKYFR